MIIILTMLTNKITLDHLKQSFDFSISYYLNPKKYKKNRTSSQNRNVGGIIDSFITGKLIEFGVIAILEKFNKNKTYALDLTIHNNPDFGDPDIIKVTDNVTCKPNMIKVTDNARDPKIFVEIKNDVDDYRWTGLFQEQYQAILNHKSVNNDKNKVYIIYASLKSTRNVSNEKKDPFGIYLKSILNDATLEEFIDLDDLYVEINHVITGTELYKNGKFFLKNVDKIYETELIKKSTIHIINNDNTIRKGFEKIVITGNKLPVDKINGYPNKLGNFTFFGSADVYLKQNKASGSLYLICKSDVIVKSDILGTFNLKSGIQYKLSIINLMDCKRNNLWVSKRNLKSITKHNNERMNEIVNLI
ncbi:MAG: hypothetical protein K8823_1617 [Cenarchaeum symbiont of Oopsacas minuta]|nr:hypothetical protein [Cenarchaeum symbiont of Oopsacas minuta]